MILVTGGAGFIGSNLVNKLTENNEEVVVCDYIDAIKKNYYKQFNKIKDFIQPKDLESYIKNNNIKIIYHLGAISSTTCNDGNKVWLSNIFLSFKIWRWSTLKKIRLIYASSAATYGNGEFGFVDSNTIDYLTSLKPLNLYAWTKNEIDKRNTISDKKLNFKPSQWVGLKFFNVYGPNENHKQNMISIALKTYKQIENNTSTKLFKSCNRKYADGEQRRDFIYVKDCIKVLIWFMYNENISGIFNVGTGAARTFNDLVNSVYKSMNKNTNITYIDMPENLKKQYQYITQADMTNLKNIGYDLPFYSLEEGIKDYVNNYLNKKI